MSGSSTAPAGWEDESSVCVRDLIHECRCPVHDDMLGISRVEEGTDLVWEYGVYLRAGDTPRVERSLVALARQVPWVEDLSGKAELLSALVVSGLNLSEALAAVETMLRLSEASTRT